MFIQGLSNEYHTVKETKVIFEQRVRCLQWQYVLFGDAEEDVLEIVNRDVPCSNCSKDRKYKEVIQQKE